MDGGLNSHLPTTAQMRELNSRTWYSGIQTIFEQQKRDLLRQVLFLFSD